MISRLALALPALCLALGLTAPAQLLAQSSEQPVVVELFTSQGCSACPPADALIGELAAREDVIALALHVDYWDYIGWVDTFGSPAHTARQHGYSHAAGSTVVYTPQMIVGGIDHVVGHRPMALADLIAQHAAAADPITVSVSQRDNGVRVEAALAAPVPAGVDLHIVSFLPHATVEIQRGENAGHTSTHYNVVHDWSVAAHWDGTAPIVLDVTPPADMRQVILFQTSDHGAILGAARLN